MTTALQDSKMLNGVGLKDSTDKVGRQTSSVVQKQVIMAEPPEIPHVEFNQLPLSILIRNLTVFSVKELAQFMKTNSHRNQDASAKKINFLQMIIYLRNQFLRIYVLIKWCKTIKRNNFHTMIDLLDWFRGTNMSVNNCIWALKNNLISMANAKLPNPDLVTALEVLSLGRPNLPTHNFKLSGDDNDTGKSIPTKLILKRLEDLNTLLSIKMSLVELPEQLYQYSIKDGRAIITVGNEFEIQLSMIDQRSPLFFVDLKLLFNENLPLNRQKLEKVINEILFKSPKPLFSLYNFLHKYVLTLQMYMIHVELLDLEVNGKYSGGNLVHHYDSKKNIITLKYWLQSRMGNKCKATIGVDKNTQCLVLRWNNGNDQNNPLNQYHNILNNLESVLDEITFNHSQMIKSDLLSTGVFQVDDENSDILLFQVPTTCVSTAPIQMKINLISGVFYFKNPSTLLLSYVRRINNSSTAEELTRILEKLKLDKIVHVLRNMFEKTGWICSDVVKLTYPILHESHKDQKKILTRDLFIRLKHWPANWYLIMSIVSSDSTCVVEKRIGKIKSVKGNWEVKYLDKLNVTTSKLESITYQSIMYLQKTILHKIVNHMIIDSLNELKISNRITNGDAMESLPDYVWPNDQQERSQSSNNNASVIAISLESFLEGSKALNSILESSMLLRIDYNNSEIRLFGKFKRNTQLIRCQCDELLIHFIEKGSLSFYMGEKFSSLSVIVEYMAKFRQKLMQLVVLTDVIDRLHNNFYSEYFSIVRLRPNEITFKYLKSSEDVQDCTVKIITDDHNVEKLKVILSPSNPQHIIQPFIEQGGYDHHFIFNYLQFTSRFFGVLKQILAKETLHGMSTTVFLKLHNLSRYQLVYYNHGNNSKITLIIELKNVSHNGKRKLQYYIHFSDDEHISTKSPVYPLVHQVRNTVFMIDNSALVNGKITNASPKKPKYPSAIKLSDGISCDSSDVEGVIFEIDSILNSNNTVVAT